MVEKECNGKMLVLASLLIAVSVVVGAYLISTLEVKPQVDVSDITSTPNIYVSSNPPEHVLSVSGTASERVTPDLLNLMVRIETQDKDAQTSMGENANVSADVRAELKGLGITDEEMKTVSYRVDPVWNSTRVCDTFGCDYRSVIVGYKTIHQLNVRTTDLSKGGPVIDAVAGAGENEVFVDSVSFSLQEETRRELQKDLLKEAGEAAEDKAKSMAEGLGTTLGKVVQASESVYYPQPYTYRTYDYAMAAEAVAAPTMLSAGEVEVSATVSASYELS